MRDTSPEGAKRDASGSVVPRVEMAARGESLPGRRCGECGVWSLRWIERPRCYTHASDEERALNRGANATFYAALDARASARPKVVEPPTIEELIGVGMDAEDTIAGIDRLLAFLPGMSAVLRIDSLTSQIEDVRSSLVALGRATSVLRQELPVAAYFPDGSPAPRTPTPKQLVYLAALAGVDFAALEKAERASARLGGSDPWGDESFGEPPAEERIAPIIDIERFRPRSSGS